MDHRKLVDDVAKRLHNRRIYSDFDEEFEGTGTDKVIDLAEADWQSITSLPTETLEKTFSIASGIKQVQDNKRNQIDFKKQENSQNELKSKSEVLRKITNTKSSTSPENEIDFTKRENSQNKMKIKSEVLRKITNTKSSTSPGNEIDFTKQENPQNKLKSKSEVLRKVINTKSSTSPGNEIDFKKQENSQNKMKSKSEVLRKVTNTKSSTSPEWITSVKSDMQYIIDNDQRSKPKNFKEKIDKVEIALNEICQSVDDILSNLIHTDEVFYFRRNSNKTEENKTAIRPSENDSVSNKKEIKLPKNYSNTTALFESSVFKTAHNANKALNIDEKKSIFENWYEKTNNDNRLRFQNSDSKQKLSTQEINNKNNLSVSNNLLRYYGNNETQKNVNEKAEAKNRRSDTLSSIYSEVNETFSSFEAAQDNFYYEPDVSENDTFLSLSIYEDVGAVGSNQKSFNNNLSANMPPTQTINVEAHISIHSFSDADGPRSMFPVDGLTEKNFQDLVDDRDFITSDSEHEASFQESNKQIVGESETELTNFLPTDILEEFLSTGKKYKDLVHKSVNGNESRPHFKNSLNNFLKDNRNSADANASVIKRTNRRESQSFGPNKKSLIYKQKDENDDEINPKDLSGSQSSNKSSNSLTLDHNKSILHLDRPVSISSRSLTPTKQESGNNNSIKSPLSSALEKSRIIQNKAASSSTVRMLSDHLKQKVNDSTRKDNSTYTTKSSPTFQTPNDMEKQKLFLSKFDPNKYAIGLNRNSSKNTLEGNSKKITYNAPKTANQTPIAESSVAYGKHLMGSVEAGKLKEKGINDNAQQIQVAKSNVAFERKHSMKSIEDGSSETQPANDKAQVIENRMLAMVRSTVKANTVPGKHVVFVEPPKKEGKR